jgi:hypothetical protein
MDKNYGKPVKVRKKEAANADSVVCAVDSLSPKEYTLQRRIDSYLRAKKEKTVHSFDTASLKKDLQSMINSYGKVINNKKRNPLTKKLGYYYAVMMDIEGKATRSVNKARKTSKPQADRK